MIHRPLSLVFLFSIAATALVACGDPEIQKASLEEQAMKMLTASAGQPSPQITCPGNLKAKVGEKMTCTMPLDGKQHDVHIAVTGVEGGQAKFNVEVDAKPHG